MSNKVFLISEPDDIVQDGERLLFVNLDDTQTQLVSACLTSLEKIPTIIIYLWHTGDDVEWLLDKKRKSDIIIFNADSPDDLTTGYLAAQPSSFYFGTLRQFNKANVNQITDEQRLKLLLTHYL